MIDNEAVKNLLLKLSETEIKGIVLGAVTNEGDLHTAFLGPLELQSLILTVAQATVEQNILANLSSSKKEDYIQGVPV